MINLDADAGRDFAELDARETQEALAEELAEAEGKKQTVADEVDEDAETETAVEMQMNAEGAVVTNWSEEDLARHERMAEALLFAAAEPLDERALAERLPEGADIALLIERIEARYEGRGVNLRKTDKAWRFVTAQDVAFVLDKEKVTPKKLSRAAMETLAIIAYHQPCTRADIEDVRGVQVAKGSLDQLLEIGWVRLAGKRRDVPGRPTLYRTTQDFLEHFGLETVQDLPGLADLKAAGLLDARLPPGFSVPNPSDIGDGEDEDDDDEGADFAQDFLSDEAEEAADA